MDYLLYDSYESEKALIIGPKRVVQDTWKREASKWAHTRHLESDMVLLDGTAAERRKALKGNGSIFLIGRELVEWLVSELGTAWDFDTVVIDELSSFKNGQSKRFRALRRVRPMMKRVIGLTGTPAPNGLMDLWPEIYLLDRGDRLGKTITGYRDRYFTPGARSGHVVYEWKQKQEAEQRIYEAISDIAVSMKSEDWLELPERIDRIVPVKLSEPARDLYKKLEKDMLLPYLDADVVAITAAVLSNKLLQMSSGAVYDEERGIKQIHDAKLDALEDLIEAANGKPVMVFYNFKHSLARIQERFPKAQILRKGKDGSQDIVDWNNDKTPLLLLHPKSAGHGLNLQESSCQTIIWFDMSWSLEEVQQANARVHRQGQTRRIVVMQLVAEGTIDGDVVEAITQKAAGQDALMDAVKARIERVRSE